MTITADGKMERRSEKPNVRTVFPPQPPLPGSESSNLSNITYTEVLSANDDFGRGDKDVNALMRSDSDSSNHRCHSPSAYSLMFVVEPQNDQQTPVTNDLQYEDSRPSSATYDYDRSKPTPENHDY